MTVIWAGARYRPEISERRAKLQERKHFKEQNEDTF
jgi:hypothetical protein